MNRPEVVIGTGLSGLVGSRIVELNPDLTFHDASLATGIDILDKKQLEKFFKDHPQARTVIHLAAFTDTNAAWEQRGNKNALCYLLNVKGTQNIVDLCREYGKYLVVVSTDYVHNGQKKGKYTEQDMPHPLEWYGQTKAMAEKIVLDSGLPASIVRIAFPYRASFDPKVDLVRKIIGKLQNNEPVTMFTDQITTPTFIDDIALGLRLIIDDKPSDVYHLVGSSSQSPFDMAKKIAQVFGLDANLVKPSSLEDYSRTPGARPFARNLALSNQKFVDEFGYTLRSLTSGLEELRRQIALLPSPRN